MHIEHANNSIHTVAAIFHKISVLTEAVLTHNNLSFFPNFLPRASKATSMGIATV